MQTEQTKTAVTVDVELINLDSKNPQRTHRFLARPLNNNGNNYSSNNKFNRPYRWTSKSLAGFHQSPHRNNWPYDNCHCSPSCVKYERSQSADSSRHQYTPSNQHCSNSGPTFQSPRYSPSPSRPKNLTLSVKATQQPE